MLLCQLGSSRDGSSPRALPIHHNQPGAALPLPEELHLCKAQVCRAASPKSQPWSGPSFTICIYLSGILHASERQIAVIC